MERLVRVEKFLLKLRNRIDRVGIDVSTIEVRFEHLNVEAETHEGSRALPSFINFCTNILEILGLEICADTMFGMEC
ncbi:pleiotropic drug resistance protein 1-like [Eucalyptus grandis]|uniref:pleiotropic drug resistance protein 1-like n=1 Tax=Eucalyptus grandis TaxID=71139 RepID=UPI00192EEB7C|nr:pleiotropic drug resistance protein 1-like [Eucalyptus grandis]